MNKKILKWLAILVIILLPACSQSQSGLKSNQPKRLEITVSAAASLNNALTEIKSDFEKKNNQISVLFNFGGSGALKQQIIQGAPTDLFISAAKDQFDELTEKGFIDKKNQTNLLGNQLVLITNKKKPADINSVFSLNKSSITKIAIGTPESVPAGMYAKQAIQHFKIWKEIQHKLVQTKDVRQVLTYVETDSVDAGIVYMTDAAVSDKVKVAAIVQDNAHEPIIYPAGVITESVHKKAAILFFNFLQSKKARTIFEKYGFKVLD